MIQPFLYQQSDDPIRVENKVPPVSVLVTDLPIAMGQLISAPPPPPSRREDKMSKSDSREQGDELRSLRQDGDILGGRLFRDCGLWLVAFWPVVRAYRLRGSRSLAGVFRRGGRHGARRCGGEFDIGYVYALNKKIRRVALQGCRAREFCNQTSMDTCSDLLPGMLSIYTFWRKCTLRVNGGPFGAHQDRRQPF